VRPEAFAAGSRWLGPGTPAQRVPTGQLVARGLYRYIRNPVYLGVLAVITGQALLLSRPVLLACAAAMGAALIASACGYEQPALARRYGARYEACRRAVPGWWPDHRAQVLRINVARGPRPAACRAAWQPGERA
jgi:protein-S-isoprenylcysteine O-methyltransferase Ste14